MYRVAIIGVGKGGQGIGGHSIGYIHGRCYKAQGQCEIVAVADISEENLTNFSEESGRECQRNGCGHDSDARAREHDTCDRQDEHRRRPPGRGGRPINSRR